jgi:hypothetical protein
MPMIPEPHWSCLGGLMKFKIVSLMEYSFRPILQFLIKLRHWLPSVFSWATMQNCPAPFLLR